MKVEVQAELISPVLFCAAGYTGRDESVLQKRPLREKRSFRLWCDYNYWYLLVAVRMMSNARDV